MNTHAILAMIMYISYCTAAKKNNSDVIVHTVTKVGTEELNSINVKYVSFIVLPFGYYSLRMLSKYGRIIS